MVPGITKSPPRYNFFYLFSTCKYTGHCSSGSTLNLFAEVCVDPFCINCVRILSPDPTFSLSEKCDQCREVKESWLRVIGPYVCEYFISGGGQTHTRVENPLSTFTSNSRSSDPKRSRRGGFSFPCEAIYLFKYCSKPAKYGRRYQPR